MLARYRFITHSCTEVAEHATQIFGGRAITATGMGRLIENVSLLYLTQDDRTDELYDHPRNVH